MHSIEQNGIVLAKWIKPSDIQPGLSFFSENADFLQVGTWEYGTGKELLAHVHNIAERTIDRTHEVLYVIQGRVEATIYTVDAVEVEKFVLESGDILVLLTSGHGYRILDENTRVLEIKNGPYLGAEIDRHRIQTGI